MRSALFSCFARVVPAASPHGRVGRWTAAYLLLMLNGSAAADPIACESLALVDAITAANAMGGGTIELASPCTYSFTSANNFWYGPNALPPITSAIVIEGHGAVLEANPIGATTPTTADAFRFFYVSGGLQLPSGALTLRQLTIRGGYAKGGDAGFGGAAAGLGGAIFNQGALNLDAVTLHANTAQGGNFNFQGYAGAGMGEDAVGYQGAGFGGELGGSYGGLGGLGASGGGGGGGGFIQGANGNNGDALNNVQGGIGGGLGALATPGTSGDGGRGGNYGNAAGGAGGGGVGGGGGGGAANPNGNGGAFGQGGRGGTGSGGSGGFGGGGGAAGGGFGFTGGAGGFGAGGGGSFGGVGGQGGFGGGAGSAVSAWGGAGAGMGGAIFNHRGSVTLVNVTLSANQARGGSVYDDQVGTPSRPGSGLGGAIFNLNGSLALDFCTLAGNSVAGSNAASESSGPGNGSALYSLASGNKIEDGSASFASVSLSNSIVYGNSGAMHALVAHRRSGASLNDSGVQYVGANIVSAHVELNGASSSGPQPLVADPNLGSLADNGGLTPTHLPALGSPAIDAATALADSPDTDQRGYLRLFGAAPDLGAVEVGSQAASAPLITSPTLPDGQFGQSYSFSIQTSGAPAPTFSLASGALPPGLSLDANTGVVSGIPTQVGPPGSFSGSISASNGVGSPAMQAFAMGIAAALPSAPSITLAVPSDGGLSLTFDAPAQSGGVPILHYLAACSPGTHSGTATQSPITVAGLTNGQIYSCAVRAVNVAGEGSVSTSVRVIPTATLTTDVLITKTNGADFVSGGEPTIYVIQVRNPGPAGVAGVRVQDLLSSDFAEAEWTCTGIHGGQCVPGGIGSIDTLVDLPPTSEVSFVLTARVQSLPENAVTNTATITVPAPVSDTNLSNNSVTDGPDVRGLFRHGME